MGKLTLFNISLHGNPNAVYFAGSTIQGCVTLELSEPMKMRGITLRFYGGANVHWTETRRSEKLRIVRHYRSAQQFFDDSLVLYGKAPNQSDDNPIHPAGRHQYPFHYKLPQNLPSSFESDSGQVRYWLNCVIDKPWKFNYNSKLAYTVVSNLDMNTVQGALEPQSGSYARNVRCCCCTSGPIEAKFHIDRCGYVPGEFIVLSGEVTNDSRWKMSSSRVDLRMYVTYYCPTNTITKHTTVASIRKGEIKPGGTAVWSGEKFHIPPLPPSDLLHCDIIDIEYFLVLFVDPTGVAYDLEVALQLFIGTVPLKNMFTSFANSLPPPVDPSVPQNLYGDGGNVITSAPLSAMILPNEPTNAAVPPPSYAPYGIAKIDIHAEGDSQYTHGEMKFSPAYSYYNWNQNARQGPQGAAAQSPSYSVSSQVHRNQPQPYGPPVVEM